MFIDLKVPHEMRIVYIQRRRTDLLECDKALGSADFIFLEKIGHQVKGNAKSFGFDVLSPLGIALESAAQEKNLPKATAIVKQFNEAIEKIKI